MFARNKPTIIGGLFLGKMNLEILQYSYCYDYVDYIVIDAGGNQGSKATIRSHSNPSRTALNRFKICYIVFR